jgi:hypothetical protein
MRAKKKQAKNELIFWLLLKNVWRNFLLKLCKTLKKKQLEEKANPTEQMFLHKKKIECNETYDGFGQKKFCGWNKQKTILKQNKKQSRRSEVLFLVQYKFLF